MSSQLSKISKNDGHSVLILFVHSIIVNAYLLKTSCYCFWSILYIILCILSVLSYAKDLKVNMISSRPNHPQSNIKVERSDRELGKKL